MKLTPFSKTRATGSPSFSAASLTPSSSRTIKPSSSWHRPYIHFLFCPHKTWTELTNSQSATISSTADTFTHDLHSIYAAYVGVFEARAVPWWERRWGFWFTSSENFLSFGWSARGELSSSSFCERRCLRTDSLGSHL
jgi:hypothetical protein